MSKFKNCFVAGCENETQRGASRTFSDPDKVVHYFKTNPLAPPEILEKWREAIPPRRGRDGNEVTFDFKSTKHRICERHFEEECFIRGGAFTVNGKLEFLDMIRWKLVPGAVPTKFLGKRPNKRRKRAPATYPKRRRDSSTSSSAIPCSSEGSSKMFENLRKDFFCSICLESFTGGLEFLKSLKSKETAYLQFIKFIGKYLNIKEFQSLEERFREKDHHKKRQSSCLYRSVCDKCIGPVTEILELFQEIELLQIRLNNTILKVNRECFEGEGVSERRAVLEEKLTDTENLRNLKNLITVHEAINENRNKFLVPRVRLKRMNYGTDADENSNAFDRQLKGNLKSKSGTGTSDSNSNLVFGRSSSLLNLLGFENKPILRCHSCDKHLSSRIDLDKHKKLYHSTSKYPSVTVEPPAPEIPQPASTSPPEEESPSPTIEDEAPPSNTSVLMEASGSTSSVEPKTPTLVLNDTLIQGNSDERQDNGNQNGEELDDGGDDALSLTSCPSPVGEDFDEVETSLAFAQAQSEETTSLPPPDPPNPEDGTEDEVKPEDTDDATSTPKKVPFMSSEYIGKYKILCKLKNIKTGKTCVGVVAKTPTTPTPLNTTPGSSSSQEASTSETKNVGVVPKVISVKPFRQREIISIPPISGPPYKCPVDGCDKEFSFLRKCISHYRLHIRRLDRIQRRIESGEGPTVTKKRIRIKRSISRRRKRSTSPQKINSETLTRSKKKGVKLIRKKYNEAYQYSCEIDKCFFRSPTKELLDYHHSLKHTPFPCQFCSEKFPNAVKLTSHEHTDHPHQHLNSDKPPDSSKPGCPRCGQPIVADSLLKHYGSVHLQIPTPKPTFHRRFCDICNLSIFPFQNYLHHMIQVHGAEEDSILDKELPHKCDKCSKRFRKKANLLQHQQLLHVEGKQRASRAPLYHCTICGTDFRFRWFYDNHMKRHSEDPSWMGSQKAPRAVASIRSHPCKICGNLYSSSGMLKRHLNYHTKPKSERTSLTQEIGGGTTSKDGFICNQCGKSFTKYTAYYGHMWYHRKREGMAPKQPLQIPCPFCPKIWPNRGFLKYHLRRVHPEEAPKFEIDPETGFVCHQCGKVYAIKQCLQRHLVKWCPGTVKGDND